MHSTTTSADVRVALWGWSGQMQEGGETVKQRLDKGLEVGDVVEVKKILKEGECALASRPGQDKVTLFSELKPDRVKEDDRGGDEGLCALSFLWLSLQDLLCARRG